MKKISTWFESSQFCPKSILSCSNCNIKMSFHCSKVSPCVWKDKAHHTEEKLLHQVQPMMLWMILRCLSPTTSTGNWSASMGNCTFVHVSRASWDAVRHFKYLVSSLLCTYKTHWLTKCFDHVRHNITQNQLDAPRGDQPYSLPVKTLHYFIKIIYRAKHECHLGHE